MSTILCRICLRTGIRTKDIDENILFFHDEICDFVVLNYPVLSFCTICEYKLRKFYNFKQKCQRAYTVLQTKKVELKTKQINGLYKLMPPDSIGPLTPNDRQAVYCFSSDVDPSILDNQYVVPYIQLPTHTVKSEKIKPQNIKIEIDNDTDNNSETELNELEFLEISNSHYESNNTDIKIEFDIDNVPIANQELKTEIQNESKQTESINESHQTESSTNGSKQTESSTNESHQTESITNESNQTESSNNEMSKKTKPKKKITKKQKIINDVSYLSDILTKKQLAFLSRMNITKPAKAVLKTEKSMVDLKERALTLIDDEDLDFGDVVLTKELFLKMLANCDEDEIKRQGVFKKDREQTARLKKFLTYLVKRFNPEYETVFDMEYLTTRDMKLAEFNSRKDNALYLAAVYKCEICFRGFDKKSTLEYHSQWHDESRQHACDICSMRFSTRPHLKTHLRTHYCIYKCKLCDVVTYSHPAMQNHFHSHKGVRYTCNVCLSEYRSRSALNTHRLIHATHPCPICEYRFKSSLGLKYHMKVKHQNESGESQTVKTKKYRTVQWFNCRKRDCTRRFSTASEMRDHAAQTGHMQIRPAVWHSRDKNEPRKTRIRVFGPDKPYRTCPVCQEQVPNTHQQSLFRHHTEKHPNVPFTPACAPKENLCEHCGKSFISKSSYQDHLNTHTGERPYACEECPKRFHSQHCLAGHRERHLPPRYECTFCGKKFRSGSNLLVHKRTHTGERRFKCEICSKGFLHPGSLKEHVNGVHNHVRRTKKTKKN